ncbi:MAG: GTPase ObgE [Negativicoccus succinicivorans]|nr:GTPase ObgE [Negativicoccus succinicivorans]
MFIDRARILIESGSGGNGMSSFRREKYVPKGGPSGGDGGHGGAVILRATRNMNTLIDFRYRRIFKAKPGENGQSSNKFGKDANDLYIDVPLGTSVYDDESDKLLADLVADGEEYVALKGGRGGRGNARFATSANRAPKFAEQGEPGQERWLRLELKVLADVGIIGYPSVGKSSLIRKVSAAKPEVAAYPFTTLTPSLGVVRLDEERQFVMADIPGLIEGASKGVGLGHQFLRHVERSKVLLHMVDITGSEGRDPLEDVEIINTELALYSDLLPQKRQLIVANKIDALSDVEELRNFTKIQTEKGREVFPISTVTGEGIPALLQRTWEVLQEVAMEAQEEPAVIDEAIYDETPQPDFMVTRGDDAAYELHGRRIERLVGMTNFDDDYSVLRFQKIWRYMELDEFLREHGVKQGDTIRIGEVEFTFEE